MKTWIIYWRNLQARERNVLQGGGGILLFALLYAYLWLPLQQQRQHLHDILPRVRVQAMQLQSARDEVLALKTRVGSVNRSTQPLQQALTQSSTALNLTPERVEMQGENKATLVFKNIRFAQWLRWLHGLQTQHGVRVETLEIAATAEAGMVNVHVMVNVE